MPRPTSMPRNTSIPGYKGFTLLEALAAFIVFAVMISGAYSLLIEAIKLHQRQQKLVKDSFFLFNDKQNKGASINHLGGFKYQVLKYHNLKVLRFLP